MRYKPVEVTRITVDPIKRKDVADIKTSLYVFARLLDQVHLREAHGETMGDEEIPSGWLPKQSVLRQHPP
jgi:hypothetical protein